MIEQFRWVSVKSPRISGAAGVAASGRVQEFRYDYLQCFQAVKGWRVTRMKPLTVDRMNRLLVAERVTWL